MKKKLALILAAVIAMSALTGCGADSSSATSATSDTQATNAAAENEPAESVTTSATEQSTTAATTTEATTTASTTKTTTTAAATTAATTTTASTTETPVVEERPEDIAARELIEKSESYDYDTNKFDVDGYYNDPYELFPELDEQSYSIILDDLSEKTNSAHEQIEQYYDELACIWTGDESSGVLGWTRFYYEEAYNYYGTALTYVEFLSGKEFANGDGIRVWDIVAYLPYYFELNRGNPDKLCFDYVLDEMETIVLADTPIGDFPDYDPNNTLVSKLPNFFTMAYLGDIVKGDFKSLANCEFVYSTPIIASEEDTEPFIYCTGERPVAYFIPYYETTMDIYELAAFDDNNNLITVIY